MGKPQYVQNIHETQKDINVFESIIYQLETAIQQEHTQKYIQISKTNIDKHIYNMDYRKVFTLFIMVLERLDHA